MATDGRTYPLRSAVVRARARGGLAATSLLQRFVNPHAESLEVVYTLPLPADGAVLGYKVRVGERVIRAEIQPREEASQAYRKALYQGRTAALLELERDDTFRQSLGHVPAGTGVEVEIDVLHPLSFEPSTAADSASWVYRFPTVAGIRYLGEPGRVPDAERIDPDRDDSGAIPARMELELVVEDAADGPAGLRSPSHAIGSEFTPGGVVVRFDSPQRLDRDVVVCWPACRNEVGIAVVEGGGREGDLGRYASHAGSTSCRAKIPQPTIQPPKRLRSLKSTGIPGFSCRGVRVSDGRQKFASSSGPCARRNWNQSWSVTAIRPFMGSPRPPEHLIALFKARRIRLLFPGPRDHDEVLPVQILQPVAEHRAVLLLEDVVPDLDHQVRPDAEDVPIEGGVVDLAQRNPIGDHRVAVRMPIREDVRGLEQFDVPQPANRAALTVGPEDAGTKLLLMHPPLGEHRDVLAANRRGRLGHPGLEWDDRPPVVDLDAKGEFGGIVADDEHRVFGVVPSGHETDEVDERNLAPHGLAKPHVVRVRRVEAAVLVVNHTAHADRVVVGSGLPRAFRRGHDAQGHVG